MLQIFSPLDLTVSIVEILEMFLSLIVSRLANSVHLDVFSLWLGFKFGVFEQRGVGGVVGGCLEPTLVRKFSHHLSCLMLNVFL